MVMLIEELTADGIMPQLIQPGSFHRYKNDVELREGGILEISLQQCLHF